MIRTLLVLCIAAASANSTLAREPAPASAPAEINLRKTVTVEVVHNTKDAVVNISTTKLISRRMTPDFFWQQFDSAQRVPAHSLGSGFIIHPDGYVVTNHHVIDQARQIRVELADGRKLDADLLSSDPEADLALLRIHSKNPLPALQLGDSSDLMIGEPVIAVGNPFGYSHSVSTGIVSAIHRELKDAQNRATLSDLIQTDAAINPGNSGGPLLNAYGQVIGINTAIRGDAQNIGFSIQVNKLRDLIPELMNPAQVTKIDVPLKLSEGRRLIEPATIESLLHCQGDEGRTLRTINGEQTHDIVDAYALLLRAHAGDKITLGFSGGPETVLTAKDVPLPDAIVQARQRLGVTIEPLTPMLADRYGLQADRGMLITEVARKGPAEHAGLKPGDVIIQLGRYRIATMNDFAALVPRLPEGGRVRVGVIRGQQVGFGMLDLQQRDEGVAD